MIVLKSDREIDIMRQAGLISFELLELVSSQIRPGVSTQELNDFVHEETKKRGAISAPLNYKGFPKSICTSINHVVCHGIPSPKEILKEGDIINVDVTPILNGFHGDSSRTFKVGEVSKTAARLVDCAKDCLDLAISILGPNTRIGDIGAVILERAQKDGFSVVRDFVGHGIGRKFHEDPQVPHYGTKGKGLRLQPGMVFTIEPMINEGDFRCKILADKWTAVTVDRKLSAQFEHTIAIRSDGSVQILTGSP